MKTIQRHKIEALMRANPNEVFGVSFIKKDRTRRTMSCRFGVTKHLKGGERSWSRRDYPQYLTVFDMNAEGYRTVNLDTVYRVSVHGEEFNVVD